MLEVSQPSDFLPAASGKDSDPVRKDDVLLLPFLAFALEREVLDHLARDLAVVLLDEVVCFKLVFYGGDVQRRLAGRIGDEDNERELVRVFERRPQGKGERTERAFPRSTEADDEESAKFLVL
jgi:hypothetical protein